MAQHLLVRINSPGLEIGRVDKPIVSVAGLRGIVGDTFTTDVILPYVAAFADMVKKKRVVVGGDSRPSREWAQPVVEAILRSRGIDVVPIDLAPTPTVGLMVRELNAGGGIVITASHNPIEWNGLKFFNKDGEFLSEKEHKKLSALMKKPPVPKKALKIGKNIDENAPLQRHIGKVVEIIEPMMPKRRKKLRVVLDCCNGAASIIGPLLASTMGTMPEIIFNSPGRLFPREAEPLPQNLRALKREVKRTGSDFGAAFDPDADRLALVDETGRAIGEERTLLLAADAYYSATKSSSPLGVNMSTSQAIDELARKYGVDVYRSKIGEAHVLAQMKKVGAEIGGEGNGGVILPAVHTGRDAATALALIILGMQKGRRTLSKWNSEFTDYVMVKTKFSAENSTLPKLMKRARSMFPDAIDIDELDGAKFIFENNAFLHMRPSGTEPIIRVFIEAPDKLSAKEIIKRAQAILQ
mgnify:CR=1 FL=1